MRTRLGLIALFLLAAGMLIVPLAAQDSVVEDGDLTIVTGAVTFGSDGSIIVAGIIIAPASAFNPSMLREGDLVIITGVLLNETTLQAVSLEFFEDDPAEVTPEPTYETCGSLDHPVAQSVAERFGVPVDEVIALHCAGNGYGNIIRAYTLAELADDGSTAADFLARHQGGEGWGDIMRESGVDPYIDPLSLPPTLTPEQVVLINPSLTEAINNTPDVFFEINGNVASPKPVQGLYQLDGEKLWLVDQNGTRLMFFDQQRGVITTENWVRPVLSANNITFYISSDFVEGQVYDNPVYGVSFVDSSMQGKNPYLSTDPRYQDNIRNNRAGTLDNPPLIKDIYDGKTNSAIFMATAAAMFATSSANPSEDEIIRAYDALVNGTDYTFNVGTLTANLRNGISIYLEKETDQPLFNNKISPLNIAPVNVESAGSSGGRLRITISAGDYGLGPQVANLVKGALGIQLYRQGVAPDIPDPNGREFVYKSLATTSILMGANGDWVTPFVTLVGSGTNGGQLRIKWSY